MASFSRRIVLDVGASAIRLGEVLPDKKGSPILRNLRSLELGIDPTKPSEFFPAVLQQLEGFVKSSGIKAGATTLCMGGPSVFTRVIKVPQTDPTQVKQMVGFEAQQAIPAIEEACWDFQIFPSGSGGELEAMILAIKKESVEEMIAASAKAGLTVESVELAPAAVINAFRYNYPEITDSVLILEVGARSTQIIIVEDCKIFCRIVPLGGASVTQAIATDLQESFAGAETLKKAKGFVHPGGSYADPSDEAASRISKLSRGVITRLHTEIERSITFYRSQQGGNRPTQLFLAGGGVELGLIDFFFREKLKIPVKHFQPFRRLVVEDVQSPEMLGQFPAWTCFVGTALRLLPDIPCRFHILSRIKNKSLTQSKDRPAMAALAASAAILLLLPGIHGFWQANKVESVISPQKDEVDQAETVLSKLQASSQKLNELLSSCEVALRLQEERSRWPNLLSGIAAKCLPGMWITKLEVLSNMADSTASPVPSKGSPESRNVTVQLSGIFETKSEESDAAVVDAFSRSLEEAGILQKVVTVERETPERALDGKTEQVALTFTLRGEWNPSPPGSEGPGVKGSKK